MVKRKTISKANYVSYCIPLILACFTSTANYVICNNGALSYRSLSFIVQVILFFLLFAILFTTSEHVLLKHKDDDCLAATDVATKQSSFRSALQLQWQATDVAKAMLFILVAWLPYIYFAWPGIIWYDPAYSTVQYIDPEIAINPNNPLLVVCLIGIVLKKSIEAWGTYTIGLTFLISLQELFTALSFAALTCFTHYLCIDWRWRKTLLLFFSFFPFFPGMFVTLTKDTLSVAPTVFFSIMIIILFKERDRRRFDWRILSLTFIAALLTSITRLANVYMVVGALFFCAITKPSLSKSVAILSIALMTFCCANYLTPAIVSQFQPVKQQSSTGLARAFAVQMVGNVARLNPEAFSEEDWDLIDSRFGLSAEEISEVYDYSIVDHLVNALRPKSNGTKNSNSPLKTLFVHAVIRCPETCIGAWSGVTAQWFSYIQAPNLIAPSYTDIVPDSFKNLPGYTGEIRNEPFLRDMHSTISSLPIIRLLYCKALYATLVPCFMLFVIIRAPKGMRWYLFAACVFVWLNCCYLLLCPTSRTQTGSRYLLPLLSVLPTYISFVFAELNKRTA